ncbi:NUDIX domain-containing protein [Nonomuraea sp. NPDC059023]|uniref:NUDIX domain-containing protein n=1 Tax=unclassified Nonomuraea TaxID=2593643 RepID=UPI003687B949
MTETVDLVDSGGRIAIPAIPRYDIGRYHDFYLQIVIVVIHNARGEILVHQRSLCKDVNPGDIDHVCGAIISGETPLDAARREVREETGVSLRELTLLSHGINSYGRYRYLLLGSTDEQPRQDSVDAQEVAWVGYDRPESLALKCSSGELTFTDGFFEDLQIARPYLPDRDY